MLRLGIATLALAEGFTFTIGRPVASQDFQFKNAVLVFRTEGCASPQISATAEGLVNGRRQSVALKLMQGAKPGVYGVSQGWPAEGLWIVDLKGTCAGQSSGALVPIGPTGLIRESIRLFPRPATVSEIETSLRTLSAGGDK